MSKKEIGGCYEASGDYIMRLHLKRASEGFLLCHGTAIGHGPIKGVKFGHAWLEKKGMVLDLSNGHNIMLDKEIYYKKGNIANVKKYTADETARIILKYEHWGPWKNG